MRLLPALVLLLSATLAGPAQAQQFATACHASSSYDLTLRPDSLLFDRPSPAPQQVVLHAGALSIDGARVPLQAESEDRLALFEKDLRALVPRVRAIATQGVDIAARVLREQAGTLQLSPQTRAELESRLVARTTELKRRIATSQSTHDWQGDAARRYGDQIVADLSPLVAGDLGQQALAAAMSGDLDAAARLRDQAAGLAATLQPRLQQQLQTLQPQVDALCPAVERLAALQRDVRGADGRPLDLLQVQ